MVDLTDTSMAASGTTKKVTVNQILGAGGTATLASATISGDLTVDTSTLKVDSGNDRVGVGTASPAAGAKLGVLGATSVSASDYIGSSTWAARFIGSSNGASSGVSFLTNSSGGFPTPASIHATPIADYRSALVLTYSADSSGAGYFAVNRSSPIGANTLEHYKIDNAGVATWSNVGGVAGTAMTLNSTGLGVGVVPSAGRLHIKGGASQSPLVLDTLGYNQIVLQLNGANRGQIYADATNCLALVDSTGSNLRLVVTDSGNVGVGVTPAGTGGCLQLKSGITFPATQVASSDANTLDDYEEGTFTPTVAGSTSAGTGTYSNQTGYYTKVGRLVTVTVYLNWTAHTGTGDLRFASLPFTASSSATNYNGISIAFVQNIALTAGNVLYGSLPLATSYVSALQGPTGGGSVAAVPMDTAGEIAFTATYFV
jgi:hypothetical protein